MGRMLLATFGIKNWFTHKIGMPTETDLLELPFRR